MNLFLRVAMAATIKQMSIIVATLGALSFIFGVIAENKKVLQRKENLPYHVCLIERGLQFNFLTTF